VPSVHDAAVAFPNDSVTIAGKSTVFGIVGREEELASVHAFVDDVRRGPAALVLEGEAGVGKSTLWLAGVERARSRGLRVLSSRPAEAEHGLAHAGLGDLFEDVLDDVLDGLAAPRRRALQAALLLEEASGDPVDHRALGVAVRSVLELLSDRQRLLIAVDDVQWLDPSSSSVLAFALRRVDASDVLLLLARRLADGTHPSSVEEAVGADHVQRVPVGPPFSIPAGKTAPVRRRATTSGSRLSLRRFRPSRTRLQSHERSAEPMGCACGRRGACLDNAPTFSNDGGGASASTECRCPLEHRLRTKRLPRLTCPPGGRRIGVGSRGLAPRR
jgi:AAA ATPase domain